MNGWNKILIWAAVIIVVFGYLWWQGQVRRLAGYIQETREELKKCSWPTWEELRGSTLVIAICIAMLGIFTTLVDEALNAVFFKGLFK